MYSKLKDETGKLYGRLVVLRRNGSNKYRLAMWLCECSCGNVVTIRGNDLRTGHTTSCGCYSIDRTIAFNKKNNTTHGSTGSKTYVAWRSMKARCLNKNSESYGRYGGRGIVICDKWVDSFESFLVDMGEAPASMTLDRIDNNGDYTPGNCKWSTCEEQANNRSSNVILTVDGCSMSISMWARKVGLKRSTLEARIKNGWRHEKAVNTPVMRTTL